MPAWALGLQLGIGLLTALQPEIEAAIAAAVAAGQDTTAHQNALAQIVSAIAGFQSVLAGAIPVAPKAP
jgi:hypothetical protein